MGGASGDRTWLHEHSKKDIELLEKGFVTECSSTMIY